MATAEVNQFELTPSQIRDLVQHQPELLRPGEERGPLEGVEAEYVNDLISRTMQHEKDFAKRLFGEIEGVGAVSFSICYIGDHRDEAGINVIFEGVDGNSVLLGYINKLVEGTLEEITVSGAQSTNDDDMEDIDMEYIGPEDVLWDPIVGELARALEILESEE